jgi:hypothetical protein
MYQLKTCQLMPAQAAGKHACLMHQFFIFLDAEPKMSAERYVKLEFFTPKRSTPPRNYAEKNSTYYVISDRPLRRDNTDSEGSALVYVLILKPALCRTLALKYRPVVCSMLSSCFKHSFLSLNSHSQRVQAVLPLVLFYKA